MRAFLAGLMVLAGLILLGACANLGSLFAARAADRGREVALRLALGSSRLRILRQLMTEAVLISVTGGVVGLVGSVVILHRLSGWQPFPQFPMNIPVTPDASVYLVALALALVSGLLFGAVPVRQVLRANPYEIVKAGSSARLGRRLTVRDILLVVQIAICAVLVTSSMVAVRGLMRSMHTNFGFDPQNTLLVDTDLSMAGYSEDHVPAMQRRMIDAMRTIPGVTSVGLVGTPPLHMGWDSSPVFTDQTTDVKPSNAVAVPIMYEISPEYFQAARTSVVAGRTFTWQDDKNAPKIALVNREFASKILGSVAGAIGKHFKMPDGTRIEVVGIVEDGKYTANLAEDPQPAMFLPILQYPKATRCCWCARDAIRNNWPPPFEASCVAWIRTACLHPDMERRNEWRPVCIAHGDHVAGRSGRHGSYVVHNWNLWNGCIFGKQAAARVRNSRGPGRATQGSTARSFGAAGEVIGVWVNCRIASGTSCHKSSGVHCVSGNSARSCCIDRRCSGYVIAGPAGYMDSSAARVVG